MMVLQPFPLKSFRTSAPVLAALLVIASAWLPDIDELGAEDCSPPLKPELVAAVEKVDLAGAVDCPRSCVTPSRVASSPGLFARRFRPLCISTSWTIRR